MEHHTKIGEMLYNLRIKKGYTHRKAAELSGVSHTYIRYVESGIRPSTNTLITPSPTTLQKLSNIYDGNYQDMMILAGHISSQMVHDFTSGNIRYQTFEESKEENLYHKRISDNDIEKVIWENEYLSYKGKLLDNTDKDKIIDFLEVILKNH